jgi:hypothetical protein
MDHATESPVGQTPLAGAQQDGIPHQIHKGGATHPDATKQEPSSSKRSSDLSATKQENP